MLVRSRSLLLALLWSTAAAAGRVHAEDDARPQPIELSNVLMAWAHSPAAQRNRVLDDALAPEVQSELLAILARGVRACDCFARRVRWAWALPVPGDAEHPAIVVSFTDPPRDQARVSQHVRFAFVRYFEGRYVVTSAIALARPALAQKGASLSVRMLPRRDVDGDGQLDIALHFAELWPTSGYCGQATFASSKAAIDLHEASCEGTSEPASADAR